ncbi:MAG: cyclase family protein [Luteitalea sp.]|nr:cyclase family protein [Luteitalea sp.]
MSQRRVLFDFEIDFVNGGGLQGQQFRLDIHGQDIGDQELAALVVRDLRLLMVGEVRILNKRIIEEPHKRAAPKQDIAEWATPRIVDLSHTIESGMITYRGLPAPLVCDHMSFDDSRTHYDEGTQFNIARIDMVANTGTYVDVPYHRYHDGEDLSRVALERMADLPGTVVRVTGMTWRAIDWTVFAASEIKGYAVLVHTGWDTHWRTDRYFEGHPFLTEKAALYLRDNGAALVGIDSLNVDDTSGGTRPVHSVLLGAGIPIVEHMTGMSALPTSGFRFTAAPPRVAGMGSFPVRAYARLEP